MIPVKPAPEPDDFNDKVRIPGLRAIDEMTGRKTVRKGRKRSKVAENPEDIPTKKFPSYWTRAIDDLRKSYNEICAYSCFRIHSVTGSASVDHMVPKSIRWDLIYEWKNYRLASGLMNSRKSNNIFN